MLSRKQLAGAYCLANKHIKAAFSGDAFGCGIQHEAGTERIIDTVKHSAKPLKRFKVQDSPLPVGIHPHRSGVHDDIATAPAPGIGKRQLIVRARVPYRIPHAHGSHRYGGGTYRLCGAAPAQYDRAGSGEIHSGVARKKAKTVEIGIVAVQLAAAVDNSIDGAAAHGRLRQVVKMRHNRLLIGDGHVDALETALPKEWRKGIGAQLPQIVRIGRKRPVDFPGKTVAELFAYESVNHSISSNQFRNEEKAYRRAL